MLAFVRTMLARNHLSVTNVELHYS